MSQNKLKIECLSCNNTGEAIIYKTRKGAACIISVPSYWSLSPGGIVYCPNCVKHNKTR